MGHLNLLLKQRLYQGVVVLVWFCLFFFLQNFLHVRMFFLHVPMCASTHRGHCIHWNWSYRHL